METKKSNGLNESNESNESNELNDSIKLNPIGGFISIVPEFPNMNNEVSQEREFEPKIKTFMSIKDILYKK
jgi:hypothetical protein